MTKNWKSGKWNVVLMLGLLVLCLGMNGSATGAQEQEPGLIAIMRASPKAIEWHPQVEYASLALTVSGPNGLTVRQEFDTGKTPVFTLANRQGQRYPDGSYTYELRRIPAETKTRTGSDPSSDNGERNQPSGAFVQSGSFAVIKGAIVAEGMVEPAARPAENGWTEDQNILDDLIVTGSQCLGFDCFTDGSESFGFDTLKLKENNLQIYFDDTSTTAGFPANDWRIITNDSISGGASYFSVQDSTAAQTPFRILAGARNNALYVSSTGRVGLGTATPVLDLHIVRGDTPSVRLDQDTSSGWTAQVWDIAGNESNFFIRDTTGGSRLPFRIQPGAPTNGLTIRADGKVGLGTWSPGYSVELEKTGEDAVFAAERTGGSTAKLAATADKVQIGALTNHPLNLVVNDAPVMTLNSGGVLHVHNAGITWTLTFTQSGLTIASNSGSPNAFALDPNGNLVLAGALIESSDVNAKENFADVDGETVLARLAGLPITTWNYAADGDTVRHMGPMAQDFAAFGLGADNRHIAPLDANGVALASVQALYQRSQEQDARLAQLEKENADMEARLAALERLVQSLLQERH